MTIYLLFELAFTYFEMSSVFVANFNLAFDNGLSRVSIFEMSESFCFRERQDNFLVMIRLELYYD